MAADSSADAIPGTGGFEVLSMFDKSAILCSVQNYHRQSITNDSLFNRY